MNKAGHFRFEIRHLFYAVTIAAVLLGLSGFGKSVFQILPVLIVLYIGKWGGINSDMGTKWKLIFHVLLCVVMFPYLYLLVFDDATNPSVRPFANWIGVPVATYLVPTISVCLDAFVKYEFKSVSSYLVRSSFEILILAPIWTITWLFIEVSIRWVVI